MSDLYTDQFFRDCARGSIASARKIAPWLQELTACRSVVDIGCGTGLWLSAFRELGIDDVLGLDGAYVNQSQLVIPVQNFVAANLVAPPPLHRRFDVAICLEVAEHLPSSGNDAFIEYLTSLGPVVAFSASMPFQDGTGHINEQWLEYWVQMFGRRNYIAIDAVRSRFWNDPDVEWWYAQNMMVYVAADALPALPRLLEARALDTKPPQSHVHPRLLAYKEARLSRRPRTAEAWQEALRSTRDALRRWLKRTTADRLA